MRPGFQAYLAQFRALSEAYWSSHVEIGLKEFRARGVGGATWATGTRWKPGMSQSQIDQVEEAFGAPFPNEYRAFLAILNTPDRPANWYLFQGNDLEPAQARNIFTDWTEGMADVKRANDDVISGILFDVEQGAIWYDDWGERPEDTTKRSEYVTELVRTAPKLIPLHSHRFLISGLEIEPVPVLSIMQSDVIYYADCIEDCLAADFPDLAPGLESSEINIDQAVRMNELRAVPFWGPLMF